MRRLEKGAASSYSAWQLPNIALQIVGVRRQVPRTCTAASPTSVQVSVLWCPTSLHSLQVPALLQRPWQGGRQDRQVRLAAHFPALGCVQCHRGLLPYPHAQDCRPAPWPGLHLLPPPTWHLCFLGEGPVLGSRCRVGQCLYDSAAGWDSCRGGAAAAFGIKHPAQGSGAAARLQCLAGATHSANSLAREELYGLLAMQQQQPACGHGSGPQAFMLRYLPIFAIFARCSVYLWRSAICRASLATPPAPPALTRSSLGLRSTG